MGLKNFRNGDDYKPVALKGLLLICFFFLYSVLLAETKTDTLIYKAWRDTVRLEKAQIFVIDSNYSLVYNKSKSFQFFKYIPSDLVNLGKASFSKKNLPGLAAILAGSAILMTIDQPAINAAKQFGRYINLDATRKYKTVIKANVCNERIDILELPQNLNSTMYFIGERWPTLFTATCLKGYGLLKNDYRARRTSSQLTEAFLTTTIATQFLKQITGRESPFRATRSGGDWHLLPSHYHDDQTRYDAFPSGHMALTMATITILSGNYPEYKYIKPIGYTLMGLMGYSMLNNEVHWISDFPLGIAIGYTCGKIALSNNHQVISKKRASAGRSSSLIPMYLGQGGIGLSYHATF